MKKHWKYAMVLILVLLVSLGAGLVQAATPGVPVGIAETTETTDVGINFTYQGELIKDGSPVNGTCDMQFSMFSSSSEPYQIGGTRELTNVSVTDGRFTVQLYFGIGVYQSGARWLEIAVRCPAGSGDYVTLTPRQQLTPVPVALSLPGLYTIEDAISPTIIGGYRGNDVSDGVIGAVLAGGGAFEGCGDGSEACPQQITGDFGAIGGGQANTAGSNAVVSGGKSNDASGPFAAISGGYANQAGSYAATVPGGYHNTAGGNYSFAAGYYAEALHEGAFVWADSSIDYTELQTNKAYQFLVRATGGVGIGTNDTLANGLTVNGRVIAGGTATGVIGGEPFVARGSDSGFSMDDRAGGANPRWVIFPNAGSLNFWNGSNRMVISGSGVVTMVGLGTVGSNALCRNASNQIAYCSSSARYKTNIAPLEMGLAAIEQMQPVTFDWKDSGEADLGLVAEAVHEISPLLTTRNEDGEIEGVKYDQVTAVLVNAVQEQQDQIAALEVLLAEMEQGGVSPVRASQPTNHWLLLALVMIAILLVIAIAQGILLRRLVSQNLNAREVRNEA